jgi:hypothetical protein
VRFRNRTAASAPNIRRQPSCLLYFGHSTFWTHVHAWPRAEGGHPSNESSVLALTHKGGALHVTVCFVLFGGTGAPLAAKSDYGTKPPVRLAGRSFSTGANRTDGAR